MGVFLVDTTVDLGVTMVDITSFDWIKVQRSISSRLDGLLERKRPIKKRIVDNLFIYARTFFFVLFVFDRN